MLRDVYDGLVYQDVRFLPRPGREKERFSFIVSGQNLVLDWNSVKRRKELDNKSGMFYRRSK